MKFLISLAWKNLSRYKKRTIITASAIAFGLGLFLFIDAMLVGAEHESERNLIWYETSSARVLDEEYRDHEDTLPLKYAIENPGEIIAELESRGIPAVARTVFAGEIVMYKDPFPEDGSLMTRIIAVDPLTDDNVYRFQDTIEKGRYLKPGEDGILMGSWLAEDIGADVGYWLTIQTRTKYNSMQTIDVQIVGIVNCPNPNLNRGLIMMPLDTADYYLEMEGTVTEIDTMMPEHWISGTTIQKTIMNATATMEPNENLNKYLETRFTGIKDELEDQFSGIEFVSWRDLALDYLAIAVAKQSGTKVVLMLVFIIAAVGISNTMLMAIYERTKELGMMRAMGMLRKEIRNAFFLETAGIGIIGSTIGVLFGTLIVFPMAKWGLDFSWMIREMDVGYRITGVMYSEWHPIAMVIAFFSGIIISVIVAIIPVRRGLKIEITEALRDV